MIAPCLWQRQQLATNGGGLLLNRGQTAVAAAGRGLRHEAAHCFARRPSTPCRGVRLASLGPEWSKLHQLCLDKQLGGNDLPDAWSSAAVVHMGEQLVSLDHCGRPPRDGQCRRPPERAIRLLRRPVTALHRKLPLVPFAEPEHAVLPKCPATSAHLERDAAVPTHCRRSARGSDCPRSDFGAPLRERRRRRHGALTWSGPCGKTPRREAMSDPSHRLAR